MRNMSRAATMLALAAVALVGCKTTPTLPFWKSKSTAAVASPPPALPSDAARMATSGQQSAATGTVAAVSPAPATGYPSTDAPPFTPDVARQVTAASATSTSGAGLTGATPASASLGAIAATPYDPNSPPPPTAATAAATASPGVPTNSRYGSLTAGAAPTGYGVSSGGVETGASDPSQSYATSAASVGSSAARYGGTIAPAPTGASDSVGANFYATTPDGRYGAPMGSESTAASSTTAGGSSTIATAQPYRPGGTGTYPAAGPGGSTTQPTQFIATRPDESTPGATTATPTDASPGGSGGLALPRYR